MNYTHLLAFLLVLGLTQCTNPKTPADEITITADTTTTLAGASASLQDELASTTSPKQSSNDLSAKAYQGEGFYKIYKGDIGGYPVTMHLIKSQTYQGIDQDLKVFIHGYYYYDKYQQPIRLMQYQADEDQATMQGKTALYEESQSMENPKLAGVIDEQNNTFNGTWENDSTGKKLPFKLQEVFPWLESVNLNEYHAGDFISMNAEESEAPQVVCNISMLFPNEYNDVDGVWENMAPFVTQLMTDGNKSMIQGDPLNIIIEERDKYLAEQRAEYAADSEFFGHFQDINQYMTILWNSNKRIGFGLFIYIYAGGAHGNYGTSYYNMDVETGNIYKLSDVFAPGYENTVAKALETVARRQYKIADGESITDVFDVEKIMPNENFILTNKGILFNYPPYDIAAYAVGEVELFVPFSEIKNVLKPTFARTIEG